MKQNQTNYVEQLQTWSSDTISPLFKTWENNYYIYLNSQLEARQTNVLSTAWFRTQARNNNWYPLLNQLAVAHDNQTLFNLIIDEKLTSTIPNLYKLATALFPDSNLISIVVEAPHNVSFYIRPPVEEFSEQLWSLQGEQLMAQTGLDSDANLFVRTGLKESFSNRWGTFKFFVTTLTAHAGLKINYYLIP